MFRMYLNKNGKERQVTIMEKYYYERVKPARSLTMRQYIYRIGQYRYNWHKALEILLVLKGSIEMNCGGKSFLMEEDDLILINSNVGHASLAKKDNSIAMVIQIEPEYLEEYYHPLSDWEFAGNTDGKNRNSAQAIEIRAIMAAMMTCEESSVPLEKINQEQELNRLFYILFQMFPPRFQGDEIRTRTKNQKDLMKRLLTYVEENYKEKLSLQELSRIYQYNSSYLSIYFKNHVGINFYDYLTRIRIREATLALCSTENTILEIAVEHGFPDAKAFHTAFRKTFGKSPMEYRQQILEENRGKELLERRTFISVQNEEVNQKLLQYQRNFPKNKEGYEDFLKDRQKIEALMDGLKKQVDDSVEQLYCLQKNMEELQKQTEELQHIF